MYACKDLEQIQTPVNRSASKDDSFAQTHTFIGILPNKNDNNTASLTKL